LVWMTQNLGVFGYAIFSGLQQLVVIIGLHHIFGAIEAQLLADTGRNFLNPLMSVAIIAQGGAVLGYLVRHRRNVKTRELCIPSFISVLFGITEPALFGINLRYRFPIIGGCIGGALGGIVVYFTKLTAVGFGTTVLPGIAIADPAGNGYVNYIIAHGVAIVGGFVMTLILGKFMDKVSDDVSNKMPVSGLNLEPKADEKQTADVKEPMEEVFFGYADGQMIAMEDVKDDTFSNKVLGDGIAVIPASGKVYAPTDGTIISVFDTKHALCFSSRYGTEILIHIGVDTVNLKGKYFKAHVKDNDSVKKGQLLVEFDKDQIEREGYDTVIPMIFTDLPDEKVLEKSAPGPMTAETKSVIVRSHIER
ncbi:MAG: glucose PTS transporter subunit IIA, partial [Lachnospiraceae bacterium]|nr:glucose PTS transporter subunit IIA [Lachnospiraceae bacterium]